MSGDIETVNIYFRGINTLDNEFLLSALISHIYSQYCCISDGLILNIPVKMQAQQATYSKDLAHVMHLVFNEYVSSKKHMELENLNNNMVKYNSFRNYNNDGVSNQGLPLENGRISYLKDIFNFIVNQGQYKNNPQDLEIRYKYARYVLVLLADQLKSNLLEEKLPEAACIPSVVTKIAFPVKNIFEMFIQKSNLFYEKFTLQEQYKMIGFVGMFLYYHLKLGQSFQNDTIKSYNPIEKKPDADKKAPKRTQRQKLSAELHRLGYYGSSPQEQSKLLIGAMQIENYLLHYFQIREEFLPNKEFDRINQQLLNFAPVLCKAS
ncbi:hypothetical protein ACFL17_05680 [Pseudomonadota bacterium]